MNNYVYTAIGLVVLQAFDGFMYWIKKGTIWSCIALGLVVFGCNAGVEDDAYPAYNGEQYAPTNMGD